MSISRKYALFLTVILCVANGSHALEDVSRWKLSSPPDDQKGLQTYSIDDSYTVHQRYLRNKVKYPSIQLPQVNFNQDQKVYFELPYRSLDNRKLHLDLFLPAPIQASSLDNTAVTHKLKPHTLVLVHGGGWRSGNKSHMYALANKLAQAGHIVVIPEYRLSAEAYYPAGLIDLNYAISWAKTEGKAFGINEHKLVLVGASSGGQMAALLANTSMLPLFKQGHEQLDTQVKALIVLDGVLDFEAPLAIKYETKKGDKAAAALWFGYTYKAAPKLWREASAVNYLSPNSPATLVISSGQLRFTAGKEQLLSQLDKYNISNHYIQLDNVMHTFWLFEPYTSLVANHINEFLRLQN